MPPAGPPRGAARRPSPRCAREARPRRHPTARSRALEQLARLLHREAQIRRPQLGQGAREAQPMQPESDRGAREQHDAQLRRQPSQEALELRPALGRLQLVQIVDDEQAGLVQRLRTRDQPLDDPVAPGGGCLSPVASASPRANGVSASSTDRQNRRSSCSSCRTVTEPACAPRPASAIQERSREVFPLARPARRRRSRRVPRQAARRAPAAGPIGSRAGPRFATPTGPLAAWISGTTVAPASTGAARTARELGAMSSGTREGSALMPFRSSVAGDGRTTIPASARRVNTVPTLRMAGRA